MKIVNKYGDKLLFVLTLAFLATVLFRLWVNRPPAKAVPPSIIFTQWENGSGGKAILALIEEFESLHSGVKIVVNNKSYEDLRRELFSPDGASSLGDVIALDPLWVSELIKREIIESASDPIMFFNNIFYYNIDILREAGYSRPPKSRGEFLNCVRALTSGNLAGLALGLNGSRGIYDDVFPWIWSSGGRLIENGKPALTSRPVAESLGFLATLNSEGLISPDAFSSDSGKKLEDFVSGRATFIIAPSSEIGFIREHLGDEAFGVTSVPLPDNYAGKTFLGAAGWTAAVSSASAHKDEAALFAGFLAEKAPFFSEEAMAGQGNGFPTAISSENDVFYSKVLDITTGGELTQEFSGLPWTLLEKSFKEELAALFAGKSSAAEAAAAIQEKWEAILE